MALAAPQWLIQEVRRAKMEQDRRAGAHTSDLIANLRLSTVCDEARCPNRGECFSHRTATFLILGKVCTRSCAFCAIDSGRPPQPPDPDEPPRLAHAVKTLRLRHIVITSVTRDDLQDGGAGHYAGVVSVLRQECPGITIECLIPDFCGSFQALATLLASPPDILAHNLETVPRLYATVRCGAEYSRSLAIIKRIKDLHPGMVTKSGIMLGLGEKHQEVEEVLQDLSHAGCDMLTMGQYLAPSLHHVPVARYVEQKEFAFWQKVALSIGFKSVASGPLVRSSYRAHLYMTFLKYNLKNSETGHPNKPVERFEREAAEFTCKMVQGKRGRIIGGCGSNLARNVQNPEKISSTQST